MLTLSPEVVPAAVPVALVVAVEEEQAYMHAYTSRQCPTTAMTIMMRAIHCGVIPHLTSLVLYCDNRPRGRCGRCLSTPHRKVPDLVLLRHSHHRQPCTVM